ncbi:EamA-like transporter family protein [uncultured archaeon]|nr:EamA-like transporter family protein [uncultured archaeon]
MYMLDPSFKGYTQVIIASISYGLIGIFIKLISDIPLGSIIFYRLLFGLAAIAAYLAIFGRFDEIKLKGKKSYILLLGLFEAGAVLSYFYAVRYTTVSLAVLLLYTAPIYVTLLSPLILKENITSRSLFALLLAVTGAIIIIQPGSMLAGSMGIAGIIVGLASGLLYAMMILTSRHLKDYYSGTAQATWSMIVSIIVFSPFSMVVPSTVIFHNLFLLLLFGIVPTALGGILYLGGLRLVRAANASIISLLEPVSAVIFAFLILNEPVSMTMLLGGGLILLGAGLASLEKPIAVATK